MKRICIHVSFLLLIVLVGCNSSEKGCTDPAANNVDTEATENDGSCTYDPVWVTPELQFQLDEKVHETSGLILWDGELWTHNDNTDTRLYVLDTFTAAIKREYLLEGVVNTDWEEIAQDSEFIYVGDIGNNGSGNRTDLQILRVEKASLKSGNLSIDTISFNYSDQYDLSAAPPNQTEFDCEAFVVFSDSIYLFTKQWVTGHTTLYALSKFPGNHIARKISTFDIQGLVSGATSLEHERLVVLSCYTGLIQPFLCILYDYRGNDLLSGNKRRINLSLPFHQVEGVATTDGYKYFVSNESYSLPSEGIFPQKLHLVSLEQYLQMLQEE